LLIYQYLDALISEYCVCCC